MTSTLPPPLQVGPVADRQIWRVRPGLGVLAAIGLGGVAFDLGVRHPIGVLSFVAVTLTVLAGIVGGWAKERASVILLGLTFAPASFLVIRDSPWLIPLNVMATVALLILAAATRSRAGGIGGAFNRLIRPVSAIEPAISSYDLVARLARDALSGRDALRTCLPRLLRGLLLGAPVAIVLVALLAASDALFRSVVDIPFGVDQAIGHATIFATGAVLMTGLVGQGAWRPVHPVKPPTPLVGPIEATVVLAGVVTIYLGFVITQVVAITAGSAYVERTTGLTYAEYARAGFFQLMAAAVLTLSVIALLARHRRPGTRAAARRVLLLEESTLVLTLVTVAIAIRRLFLYEAEFGLTMLRLYTIVFAAFIGVVFVIMGLSRAGRLRSSPVTAVLAVGLSVLLAVNLANPERLVAERNINRFGGTAELDIDYLVDSLGADAIPAVLADPGATAVLCHRRPSIDNREITFNLGRARAANALASVCDR